MTDHVAAMQSRDLARQCHAEAGTLGLAVEPEERHEHPLAFVVGDAGAAIAARRSAPGRHRAATLTLTGGLP